MGIGTSSARHSRVCRSAKSVEGIQTSAAPLAQDGVLILLEDVLGQRRIGIVSGDETELVIHEEGATDDRPGLVAGNDTTDTAVAPDDVAIQFGCGTLPGDDDATEGAARNVVVVEDDLVEVCCCRSRCLRGGRQEGEGSGLVDM